KYNLPGLSNPYDRAPVGTRLGTDRLRVFVPAQDDRPWQDIGIISDARWYPTCTLLPDGSVFVVAGTIDDCGANNNQNPTYETLPPSSRGPQYLHLLTEAWPFQSYPFTCVLPSCRWFIF